MNDNTEKNSLQPCPVCLSDACSVFLSVDGREYWRCTSCVATFLHSSQLPDPVVEYTHYLTHENDSSDADYRRFLSRLAGPLMRCLPPRQSGLDFGCGPGPALAVMLREAGHEVALYDPFFRPDPETLACTYDFVTCSEAAEHFHRPAQEFQRLDRLLRPGGVLAIMTCFQTDDARFADWHYRRDPTHVVFYREETLARVARTYGWRMEVPEKDVVLMHKPTSQALSSAS